MIDMETSCLTICENWTTTIGVLISIISLITDVIGLIIAFFKLTHHSCRIENCETEITKITKNVNSISQKSQYKSEGNQNITNYNFALGSEQVEKLFEDSSNGLGS